MLPKRPLRKVFKKKKNPPEKQKQKQVYPATSGPCDDGFFGQGILILHQEP